MFMNYVTLKIFLEFLSKNVYVYDTEHRSVSLLIVYNFCIISQQVIKIQCK